MKSESEVLTQIIMAAENSPPCPVLLYYGVEESKVFMNRHMIEPDPLRPCVWSFKDPGTDRGRLLVSRSPDPKPNHIKKLFVYDASDPDTCLLQLGPPINYPYTFWFSTAAELVSFLIKISEAAIQVHTIHGVLKSKGFEGNLDDEFPEQIMAVLWLQPECKYVLELGANVGRNSCVIASLLRREGGKMLTFETNQMDAERTRSNLARCGFADLVSVEDCAISSVRLQQRHWKTRPLEGPLADLSWEVKTMTLSQVVAKHGSGFDTLVADCEGALFHILKDTPELLDTVTTIIVENDYEDLAHYDFVKDIFEARGFRCSMQMANEMAPFLTKQFFYQVWSKTLPTPTTPGIRRLSPEPYGPPPPPRRAAVCMWGLLRGARWTWESVDANIVRSLKDRDFEVDIFVHTYSSRQAYSNAWSKESAPKLLDVNSLDILPYHTAIIEDKETVVSKLQTLITLLRSKSPWFEKNFECTSTNHILALHSLERVTSEALKHHQTYSTFVFVRPDTLILEPLAPAMFESPRDVLYIPDHGRFGGYNDRFCVCGPDKALVYGSRISALPELLSDPGKVANGNSETLLAAHLKGHCVKEVTFPLRRVRLGGEMVDRQIGTLRINIERLFASVYSTTPNSSFFDPGWTSRTRFHYGFPICDIPGTAGSPSEFRLFETPQAGLPTREWLEIQGQGRRVAVVCEKEDSSFPCGPWACGSLEVALLELGLRTSNLMRSDPRIVSIQKRFVDMAAGFVFARSMATLSNLVFSFQLRSFQCIGIPDVRSIDNVSQPETAEVCMIMALIYGLALGRVYRPLRDEGTCSPRCFVRGGDKPLILSIRGKPCTFQKLKVSGFTASYYVHTPPHAPRPLYFAKILKWAKAKKLDCVRREEWVLRLLENTTIAPRVIYSNPTKHIIVTTYAGEPVSDFTPDIIAQLNNIADVLDSRGIRHNDLKKAEILVDHLGKVRVCDFGWSTVNGSWGADELRIETPSMATFKTNASHLTNRQAIEAIIKGISPAEYNPNEPTEINVGVEQVDCIEEENEQAPVVEANVIEQKQLVTRDHVQSAYEIGMSLVVNDGGEPAQGPELMPDLLLVGSDHAALTIDSPLLLKARFVVGVGSAPPEKKRHGVLFENEDMFIISQPCQRSS